MLAGLRTTTAACLALLLAACSSSAEGTNGPSAPEGAPRPAAAPNEATTAGPAAATDAKGQPVAADKKEAEEADPDADGQPRIGALGPHTWIWRKPDRSGLAIGKMRIGTSVRLKSTQPIDGADCKGKWYAIEPRGYICDDDTATLNLKDPYYQALKFSAPKKGVWPYHYAHSNGAPMYSRVPTKAEWEQAEREYGPVNTWKPLGKWAIGHEENIVDEPIKATDEVPYFLKDGKRTAPGGYYNTDVLVWRKIPAGSMLAYSKAFEANGRVWLLTPDTMIVPADRVSHMKLSTFRGVHFDETDMRLPFAWNRSKAAVPKYTRAADGHFEKTSDVLAAKTPIEITGDEIKKDGYTYFELRREPGKYVARDDDPEKTLDADVVITRPVKSLPKGIAADEKWIEAKTILGTMTAYEGLKPVMATLFSPGKGGVPLPTYKFPKDHSKYATTALGSFPLEWKEHVATMSNEKGVPKVLWFSDVPNQQYLRAPLAMHVAYWHEDYGKRKSAECLNVSPIDGDWLFGWTLPVMPEGWNAIGAGQGNGKSTTVVVTSQ